MPRRAWHAVTLILASTVLSACAVGNKIAYDGTVALDVSGRGAIAVATNDSRPYVVSGHKAPDFVGLQRGGYGNPFDVATASGAALADDFTAVITASLAARGFRAIAVKTAPGEPDSTVLPALQKTGAERSALLVLVEWKSDTYANTALIYDLTLRVLDRSGRTVATRRLNGRDDLGGDFWNPPAHAKAAVPGQFRKKLEELFASPEVAAALN